MDPKKTPRPHHATRTIAYSCQHSHVVEFYHAPKYCNRTPFFQSQPCCNTPHPTDNPSEAEATHYRLTTSTKEDSKGVRNGKCPVCSRNEWEKRWRKRMFDCDENYERRRGDNGSENLSRHFSGGNALSDEAEDEMWLSEMSFAKIWDMEGSGEWADRRPYKNMLRGVSFNGRGEEWPCGEYKGFNYGG